MSHKVLIVEDDQVIARLLQLHLSKEGYQTDVIYDGSLALDVIQRTQPDIVLLDLMLPGLNGVEICRQARTFFDGVIIVVTASIDELSEVSLFKYGADDYITKPIKASILLARIEAQLRRMPARSITSQSRKKLRLDEESKRLFCHDQEIALTASEFDVLSVLYANFGQVVSREECCKAVRGIEYSSCDRTVDMRISGLRKSLHKQGVTDIVVKTVRSKGYVLVDT